MSRPREREEAKNNSINGDRNVEINRENVTVREEKKCVTQEREMSERERERRVVRMKK